MAAKKKTAAKRKAPAKKAATRRPKAKRAAAKWAPARKTAARKAQTKKRAAKKRTATKRPSTKRAATKRPATKRPAKKSSARKAAPVAAAFAAVKGLFDTVTNAPALVAETVARVTHSTKPLAKKLRLGEGMLATVLDAPGDVRALLGELPVGAGVTTELGSQEPPFLLVFVRTQKQVERRVRELLPRLTPKTLLWFAYPKQSSKVETDLNRDRGWEAATRAKLEAVAQVAVDATWAATRFILRA